MAQKKTKRVTKKEAVGVSNPEPISPVSAESPNPTNKNGFLSLVAIAILIFVIWKGWGYFGSQTFENKSFTLKKIAEFTGTSATGSPMSAFGLTSIGPQEIAVADAKGNQVLIFNYQGKLLRKWGKRGDTGPLQFNEPSDVIMDTKKQLYVLDPWNGAVKIFTLEGKPIQSLDLKKEAVFFGPRQMAFGGDFILIPAGNAGVRLSLQGQVIDQIGKGPGSGKEEFKGADGPYVDSQGNIYLGDQGNKRVQEFDKDGKFVKAINTGMVPSSLAMDSSGRLFVASDSAPSRVFGPNGEFLGNLCLDTQPDSTISSHCININSQDEILMGNEDQIVVYKIAEKK